MTQRLPFGTKVKFDIAQGLNVGIAYIDGIDVDDGHFIYKLENIVGSQSDMHRNKKGELWVNDFEVKAIR